MSVKSPAHAPAPGTPVTKEEVEHVRALVRRHFGFDALRSGQGEVIARALRGENMLAVMPTGAGKSMCYQLPALVNPGITLVVSPLIALMKDQLDALPAPARAAATAVSSQLPPDAVRRITREIGEGRYRLVYAAPERLRQRAFLDALARGGVTRFVVDEAHCVSVWGHDFRPDYLALREARERLGNPQTLAFTATAPPRVLDDVIERLGPIGVVKTSVARPNLRFEAVLADNADEKIAHVVQLAKETIAATRGDGEADVPWRGVAGPGIIYASSQEKCEQLATALRTAGVRADHYHAGIRDRAAMQETFMRGDVDVLVATVAFGMGIDKRDVRFVIHHDPPGSLESYYQEAGRAGRDGAPARCVLAAATTDAAALTQRVRRDQPDETLVRLVWDTLKTSVDAQGYATLDPQALDALEADADPRGRVSGVKPRVALSVLAEAGLVDRLPDVPASVYVGRVNDDAHALAPFLHRNADVREVARALDVPPQDVQARLDELEDAGEAFTSTDGRALLLRVTADADWQRVKGVLARYVQRNEGRGRQVMAYVKSRVCRHAQIRRYFGEDDAPTTCGNCDNCLGITHTLPAEAVGDDNKSRHDVLAAVAEVGRIGETNLVYMLRGDSKASPWTQRKVAFGVLAHRSASVVRRLVTGLADAGYMERQTMDHGGQVLVLTSRGARAVQTLEPIDLPDAAPRGGSRSASSSRASGGGTPQRTAPADLDDAARARFEALREWRYGVSKEAGVPPYVVFADKALAAIADGDPKSKDALLEIKGVGPKKLEMFGDDVLAVLAKARGA